MHLPHLQGLLLTLQDGRPLVTPEPQGPALSLWGRPRIWARTQLHLPRGPRAPVSWSP